MPIRVALHHKTEYHYDRPIAIFPQTVRLRPAPHCRTPILSYSLKVLPKKQFVNWQQDPHGNFLARFVFPEKSQELSIEVDLVAEMTVVNPFDFFLEPSAETFPFTYDPLLAEELKPFLAVAPLGSHLAELLSGIDRSRVRSVDFLVTLNCLLHDRIKYVIRMDPGVQTCEETLRRNSGSCRDTAWLLVQTLRNLGLAARFVSGYLIQLTADIKSLDGPTGPAADFTDLHAWAEVYLPGAGWIGLDATSGLWAGEGHIPLAATPDPASAAPVTGAVDPCEAKFSFAMSVTRIHEDPRVTKPYTEEQWQRIEAIGHRVDAALEAGAVRLTMGGEPTFVSIDDMDGPEWNTLALGKNKRLLAGDLTARLRKRFAANCLLHTGQGKWYPGESLPRWALTCYWRKDGQPIWRDSSLLADDRTSYSHGDAEAQKFVAALAERLGVPDFAIPGYEDAWHYLWKEGRLPINVDPLKSKLESPEERKRLAKIFTQGLGQVVGYALPLSPQSTAEGTRWESRPWRFRGERMYLVPGDSPMGWRLPLDRLPWSAAEDWEFAEPMDPFTPRAPLGQQAELLRQRHIDVTPEPPSGAAAHAHLRAPIGSPVAAVAHAAIAGPHWATSALLEPGRAAGLEDQAAGETAQLKIAPSKLAQNGQTETNGHASPEHAPAAAAAAPLPAIGGSAQDVIRTALCVESREGRLHVFMPPIIRLEDYLGLVAAVEATAAELSLPVVVEGYPPPHDYRLSQIKVTPDPGVIEVNIHPSHSWDELVKNTTALYEDARQSRLGTEKFMLDGRHTGTGGGNHVVLGGPTPAESPFLRRPDLLRSLLTYWNNHPSLSYLFCGTFVGPTSQSPRIDEARHDSLYELEIAFQQIPDRGGCPPWLVDRVFRHLLTDLTGNTHRAEFCIDKLFSPDTSTGRLGLLEFRAFEMPPHARMSLTQQLLIRALISRFWKNPYRQQLVRWGTLLHDRYLLPHFVAQDFADVIADLNQSGYPMEAEWFAPHLEFRFPVYGDVAYAGLQIELRAAIELWNVLGEEPGGGGTARYVDSSVERLQVKVRGMTDPRHIVTCNGRRVPLHPTGTAGEFVAGVRYRAWQPPSCLHPTIPVHAPLVFDVFDTWSERSVSGCTWHVAHPGGRSYETFPVNANEAEARRVARFFKMGHTPGKMPAISEECNCDFPLTLDLRRS
jgi:uncharacterized protein (DUF2126 family)/transglutaminase-like putative cysteine protease